MDDLEVIVEAIDSGLYRSFELKNNQPDGRWRAVLHATGANHRHAEGLGFTAKSAINSMLREGGGHYTLSRIVADGFKSATDAYLSAGRALKDWQNLSNALGGVE